MLDRVALLRPVLATGIIAGTIGAVILDAYLIVTTVFIEHAAGVASIFQSHAALLVGKTLAFGNPQFGWLGLLTDLAIGSAWGIGYAYVAARTPGVAARPFSSGVVYGLIVYAAMSLMALAANVFTAPDALGFYNELVAYALFFGAPVAYIAGKRMRA